MKYLFIALALTCAMDGYAQPDPAYIKHVDAAFEAMQSENYDSCLRHYEAAFEIQKTSYLSTMRAVTCAFEKMEHPLTEKYLKQAFDIDWGGAKQVFDGYPEFDKYRKGPLSDIVYEYYMREAEKAGVNIELMNELSVIARDDQAQRQEMRATSEKYGWESPQMDSLWALQSYADSVNEVKVEKIIASYGYPGKSMVGGAQSGTVFMVIQHAPLETQLKHLDLITEAADNGELSWSSVALLVDRVNMRQGKKQLYGTQLRQDENGAYFSPIANPHKIDSIRATVGLGPIQEYADYWEITWDADEHIRFHEELEKKEAEKSEDQ